MATLFKATTMLGTLVGIPAVWIYVGPLPTEAQQTVDRLVVRGRQMLGLSATGRRLAGDLAPPVWDPSGARFAASVAPGVVPMETAMSEQRTALSTLGVATGSASDDSALALEPLLSDLRRMGAVEYRLVRWGAAGELYRFCCWLPLGGSDEHVQQFEALSGDPRESVAEVVAQASSWQAARLTAGRASQIAAR